MTDHDDFNLDRLAEPAPKANSNLRQRAIANAREVFEEEVKKRKKVQGFYSVVRLRSIIDRMGLNNMNGKWKTATALASIMIVASGGYIGVQLYKDSQGDSPTVMVAQNKPKPLMESATVKAPVPVIAKIKQENIVQTERSRVSDYSRSDDIAQKNFPSSQNYSTSKLGLEETEALPTGDRFVNKPVNAVKFTKEDPVSTFSIDVDTASYTYVRRLLKEGQLPDAQTVRVEELVNYFPYNWPKPETPETPFKSTITVAPSPWNKDTKLMHVAIKGYEVPRSQRPAANLVFLIDVSGSMNSTDKLPMLKSALRMLVNQLDADDHISIVTYANGVNVVLNATSAADRRKILDTINDLKAGGGTAGGEGLKTAYDIARKFYNKDGINRIMLATDGDFNIGPSSDEAMKALVRKERESGIYLSVLGFGRGNYNDGLMQALAQNGNGTAAYIDSLAEAQKVLVDEAGSTLIPIAKDVKIQVEFNPEQIAEYRLLGYETRTLKREDFNNDKVDAGDIGSGQSVTAVYEIVPVDSPARLRNDLRYSENAEANSSMVSNELAFLRIRYKLPDTDKSSLIETSVTAANTVEDFEKLAADVRFSVAVAAFGEKLRDVDFIQQLSYENIAQIATAARGDDLHGYRNEFISLARIADSLSNNK